MAEVGEQPDTAPVHQLLDRFVDAGAMHPVHERSPLTPAHVTVVIPAHGRLPQDLPAGVHVIVVDDASPTPLTFESAHDVPAGLRQTLLRHDTNQGPAAARNTGLAEATTPLVAFVDTDVHLPDGWLEPLLAHFADERVALAAPRVASAPGTTWLQAYEQRHSPLDLGPEPARIAAGTRVSYVPAAAMVWRTHVIRELGGFDETMRLGEDVDLVWRAAAAGHRCRYEPTSVVHHDARSSVRGLLRQRFGYGRSAAALSRRHPKALAPVRMSGWSALSWLLLAARHPLLAIGVAGGTTIALQRKLTDIPPRESARLAGLGHLAAGRQVAQAITRVWWPIAFAATLVSRRARLPIVAALVAPALIDAVRTRSTQPIADAPFVAMDQMAYGAGLWAGVLAEREVGPLWPELRNWPSRTGE